MEELGPSGGLLWFKLQDGCTHETRTWALWLDFGMSPNGDEYATASAAAIKRLVISNEPAIGQLREGHDDP